MPHQNVSKTFRWPPAVPAKDHHATVQATLCGEILLDHQVSAFRLSCSALGVWGRWPRSKSWKKWYAIDGCFMVCTCLYHPLWFIYVFTMTHRPIGTYILFMVMPWESWNNGPPFDWPSPQDWVQWATVACCNIPRRTTQHLRIS